MIRVVAPPEHLPLPDLPSGAPRRLANMVGRPSLSEPVIHPTGAGRVRKTQPSPFVLGSGDDVVRKTLFLSLFRAAPSAARENSAPITLSRSGDKTTKNSAFTTVLRNPLGGPRKLSFYHPFAQRRQDRPAPLLPYSPTPLQLPPIISLTAHRPSYRMTTHS
jgi:hypothetical protein